MTTKTEGPERVRVWHDGYKAEAHPRRVDLKKWEAAGWIVTPAEKPEIEPKA